MISYADTMLASLSPSLNMTRRDENFLRGKFLQISFPGSILKRKMIYLKRRYFLMVKLSTHLSYVQPEERTNCRVSGKTCFVVNFSSLCLSWVDLIDDLKKKIIVVAVSFFYYDALFYFFIKTGWDIRIFFV